MTFNRKNILPLLLCLFVVFFCGAQKLFGQAYNFRQLSIQNGLPQSQAFAIIFDSNQRAWIGTQGGGLCRYDGSEFNYYTRADSLLSNRIYSLKEINNEIWIGQKGGVTVYNLAGEFVKNFRLSNQSTIVADIVWHDESVLLATNDGLFQQEKNQFVQIKENPNLNEINVLKFFVSPSNELWLCTPKGLLSYIDPFNKINKARGLSTDQVECVADYNGTWLIGTYGGGINFYSKKKGIYTNGEFKFFQNEIITTLYISPSQDAWIGTMNNGVYVYNPKTKAIRNYRSENGLANNHIRVILADKWNNIWIGTSGGGISIFQNSPFIKYNKESGLNGNYVYAVANDKSNNIWVGTEGTGALRINDTSATLFDEDYGFHSSKVRTIFCDSDGDVWLGTEENGIGIYSQNSLADTIYSYNQQNGLTSNWIKCFTQDKSTGEIFIGTINGGIMRVKKNSQFPENVRFSRLKIEKGKLPNRIAFIFIFENNLWFTSSDNEYGYIKNGEVFSFTEGEVSFRNACQKENTIWLGSSENGILQLTMDRDSIKKEWLTTAQGFSSNNIYQLIWSQNNLWVGTEKGLDRLTFDSLLQIKSITHFGSEEGFEGVETNINAAYEDSDNNLWFGTVNGLYVYKGGEVNYAQHEPPVLLMNDFRIFYESIEKTEFANFYENGEMIKELILPHNQNHIGFSFKAIHYTHAKNIRYRWRLAGVDKDWTPPSTSHEATYGNLQPGSFSFEVKASIDDNWDVESKKISFSIDAPYWEKWWFKLSYYAAIFLILLLVVLIIVFRLKRKNLRIQQKFEMEKNLIELEQKALRLQMNPHFIFNVINSIHNLIILNDPDKARYALSKFSKLMRMVLENSREKFISIDSEIQTLENYVQLEKLTNQNDVNLIFEIDENIDSSEEILPPLMIQPFVENAIKHGLRHQKGAKKLNLKFQFNGVEGLTVSVEDNGIGRQASAEINSVQSNHHQSFAVEANRRRLQALWKAETNPIVMNDLYDDEGRPRGTMVTLNIPIQ